MHHANHFYGHAHLLARYAGLAEVPRIWGYLQHGWNVVDGYAVGTAFAPGYPKFVWSDAPRRRGEAMGRRHYVVVGSPWAYLLQLERQDGASADRARDGTIVYPFHGWEGQDVVGAHDRYVEEIRATEPGAVTVCLYWNEYRDPRVRAEYERAGFRVISHGYRGLNWKGTDTRFLYRQLAELRSHRRVVSNRLSSAIFYGASVGCEVGVYGDPMLLHAEDPVFGGNSRLARLWPELHQVAAPATVAAEYARAELGIGLEVDPVELRQAFGWTHARRAVVRSDAPLRTEGDVTEDVEDPEPVRNAG